MSRTGRTPTWPPIQNIPIRTEEGKKLRKAWLKPLQFPYIDYASIEQRIMNQMKEESNDGQD